MCVCVCCCCFVQLMLFAESVCYNDAELPQLETSLALLSGLQVKLQFA